MTTNHDFMDYWLSIDSIQNKVKKELENVLQAEYGLSLKEFYVLYHLSLAPDKKLRLQQLQEMIGLSQSALSRLVGNMEAKSCGALEKHVCTDDRRGTYTQLTNLGEQKLQKSLVSFREILRVQLSAIDVEGLTKQLVEKL
ncbi:helix-turn-helix domain-containing protein [Sporosarcina sp. E16_8]|uniref:MarR family winged helix-turn-helix transcriptional regulator n=1 Tax=Sporosarcina sp. E16_8 TaxID=2789295 RepID=UPI001A934B13|nr:helix-turn-helix domain-containing protein [Sporosarcina sp. E16_8]MBO0588417.1 MarR family transcriptional regulator [Sporosarcina sp. E16_8]